MWDKKASIDYLLNNVWTASQWGHGKCAAHVRAAIQAGGLTVAPPASAQAKDYGPSIEKVGFNKVSASPPPSYESGDVAVIQPIKAADAGHMCMYDGTQWVSDFKQPRGLYPSHAYENAATAFAIYRYSAAAEDPAKPTM